ncbi:MAG: exonuclease domain-containing protein [Acidimicrobiales bacterium]
MAWPERPLIGLDFETTGVDPLSDLPVQVALVWCDGKGSRRKAIWLVDPQCEIPAGAMAVHGISTERAREEGRSLEETARLVHHELERAANEGTPIVAMNASFDVTIAACLFDRAGLPPLAWDLVIDPLVIDRHVDKYRKGKRRLDALCEVYGICLEGAHDAGHDAEAALSLAREIGRRWPEAGGLDPGELTVFQQAWHYAWAEDFDRWCVNQGRPGLDPGEYLWPLRKSPTATSPTATGPPSRSDAEPAQSASDSRTMSMSSSEDRGLMMAKRMATSP